MLSNPLHVILLAIIPTIGFGQTIPVEVMIGGKEYRYQHFFAKPITGNSRLGFFHTSSMYFFYDEGKNIEMMSQSYVTYQVGSYVKAAVGTFYASVPGFKTSGALQLAHSRKDLLLLVVPRIDLWKNPSYEIMSLLEYRPSISDRVHLYTRLQVLSNYGLTQHNRSYQNLRIGLGGKNTQFGIALNLDQYGSEVVLNRSWGVFLRHELKSQ